MKRETTITQGEYSAFQQAYDFFNAHLFDSELPNCLLTLNRHAKAYGYFSPNRFLSRDDKKNAHELAMNPDHFGRTDELILSTLVHEMVHVWQETFGTPPRRAYHDKEWAAKMKEVGLYPSDTAEQGGRETGQRVSHYIIKGGRFETTLAKLKAFDLRWQSYPPADATARTKKAASKTKYTCPHCAANAWAKPESLLICGECFEADGITDPMEAQA